MQDKEEHFIVWEAPKIVPPELRLYYDDEGKILFYTCEKPEGNYIIVDTLTFAQSRYDLRVIDGKLTSINPKAIITKLKPDSTGIKCLSEDISIIATDEDEQVTHWKLDIYELR